MGFKVQENQCDTCIFKKGHGWDLPDLLKQVADPAMKGHFVSHRVCHHSKDACCAGFWAAYKDKFQVGQLAQRLDVVEFVNDDTNPFNDE